MNINQRCLQTGRKHLWPFHAAQDFFFLNRSWFWFFFPITAKHSETFFSLLAASLSGDTHVERCSARFYWKCHPCLFLFFFFLYQPLKWKCFRSVRERRQQQRRNGRGLRYGPWDALMGIGSGSQQSKQYCGDWPPSLQSSSSLLHLTLF